MQNFVELYKELSEKLSTGVPEINWIDLWNSQVYNLETEHPFPAPAVFLAFRSNNMNDLGGNVQQVVLQVDLFFFYETFADTYRGSYNQNSALAFLEIMDKANQLLHGSSGQSYSSMRRVSYLPVDTGGAGNLWSVTYSCEAIDHSAAKEYEEGGFKEMQVQQFQLP